MADTSNLPDELRTNIMETSDAQDPMMRRLDMAGTLAPNPSTDLTELSRDETLVFALIETIHKADIIKMDGMLVFFDTLRQNRVSMDRKRVSEYLKALMGVSGGSIEPGNYGSPGTLSDDEPGRKKKWQFWKR